MFGVLAFCVAGIYIFFLTWGVLQERITTIDYVSTLTGAHGRFRHFIFLNMCQSLACVAVAWIVLTYRKQGLGPTSPEVLKGYFKVAFSGSIGSPFGYAALKHVNFPTMILAKSCKLVPVMIMNWLVYRRRFETYKYVTVGLITLGVSGFMLFEPHRGSKAEAVNSLWGLSLLFINLLIDGATNSWQDQMFIFYKIKSLQMMFFMSMFSAALMFSWLFVSPWTTELSQALSFIAEYPAVLGDLALFCICGALGQLFIFMTIEKFGSLSLVTVTVTRKLFTILLSLFWFNHQLRPVQWLFVALVFVALAIESYAKRLSKNHDAKASQHTIENGKGFIKLKQ
jgi:UDP-galactose transporter B1